MSENPVPKDKWVQIASDVKRPNVGHLVYVPTQYPGNIARNAEMEKKCQVNLT